ncbi:MAG: UbiA family prenyltransferase [Planctomycetota bacterium]
MAWLQLARIALAPTILWDFFVGMSLAGLPWDGEAILALVALLSIYHAGMILNDWRDREVDLEAGRARPLVDGRITPSSALAAVGFLFVLAFGLTFQIGFHLVYPTLCLIAIVSLYDLSSGTLRRSLGPALLAAARALSLGFAVFAVYGMEHGLGVLGYGTLGSYALYFLFVSRLAQREEIGIAGMNGMAFLMMAAFTPVTLFYGSEPHWWFIPAWALFVLHLLRPVWPIRHEVWGPHQVSMLVRHGLGSAPMILGLSLIATGEHLLALLGLGSVLVSQSVRLLARRWAPE